MLIIFALPEEVGEPLFEILVTIATGFFWFAFYLSSSVHIVVPFVLGVLILVGLYYHLKNHHTAIKEQPWELMKAVTRTQDMELDVWDAGKFDG